MKPSKHSLIAGAAAAGIFLGGAGIAMAQSVGDDGQNEPADSDMPLAGEALDRASAAALAHTGGGEVVDSEAGDDIV